MDVGVRDLRNRTAEVVAAVESGESVTLTVRGQPVADIVPHRRRSRWLDGSWLRDELATKSADSELTGELNDLAGQTLDEL
jgi:prevent-host-death family protein